MSNILSLLPGIAPIAINALVDTFVAICNGIGNRAQEIVDAALNMLWKIIVAVFVGVYKFLDNAIDEIAQLIGDVWPRIKQWFKDKWNEIKETVKGWGKKIVDWFRGGVDDNVDDVYEASANMANNMIEGAEETLDEHSPSKKGADIGGYFSLGMAQGAESYSGVLYQSGAGASGSLLGGATDVLAGAQGQGLISALGGVLPEGMLEGASGYSGLLFSAGEGFSGSLFDGMLSGTNSEEKKLRLKRKGQQDGEEGYAAYAEGYEEGAKKSKLKRKERDPETVDINTVEVLTQNDAGEWIAQQRPAVEEANAELGAAGARAYSDAFSENVDINTIEVLTKNDVGEWVEFRKPAIEEANAELGEPKHILKHIKKAWTKA